MALLNFFRPTDCIIRELGEGAFTADVLINGEFVIRREPDGTYRILEAFEETRFRNANQDAAYKLFHNFSEEIAVSLGLNLCLAHALKNKTLEEHFNKNFYWCGGKVFLAEHGVPIGEYRFATNEEVKIFIRGR